MTDEPLIPSAELASAAFDGETTAAERAVVAASTTLGDEVSFYRDLRDRLADVEVSAATRESAITGALAMFDRIQAGTEDFDGAADTSDHSWTDATSAASPSPVVPRLASVVSLHQRRARQMRWLGGAVAAAFVAVFAVGVISGGSGSDNDAASSATESAAFSIASDQAAKSSPAPEPAIASENAETMADDAPDSGAQDSVVQDSEAQDSASVGSEQNVADAASDPSTLFALAGNALLATDEDVRSFVESPEFSDSSTASSPSPDSTDAPNTTTAVLDTTAASTGQSSATIVEVLGAGGFSLGRACVSDSPGRSAPALYRGDPVFVVVDPASRTASIIDATTCVVITTVVL